jgi:hypothetical protein
MESQLVLEKLLTAVCFRVANAWKRAACAEIIHACATCGIPHRMQQHLAPGLAPHRPSFRAQKSLSLMLSCFEPAPPRSGRAGNHDLMAAY